MLGAAAALFGAARTWQLEHSSNQTVFFEGTVPQPAPDGLYSGSIEGPKVSWLGKKFNAASSAGINVFDDGNGKQGERYPFKTAYGKGLRDMHIDVLTIDYNTPDNPFWMHPILDEIVQIGPDKYLGKLHVRLIPGHPFTLSYFELSK